MHASRFRVLSPIGIVICLGLVADCGGSPPDSGPAPDSTPNYLGEQPPSETPQLFAPGIVNTDAIELNGDVYWDLYAASRLEPRCRQDLRNWSMGSSSSSASRLIEPSDHAESAFNAVECAQRLGGMLRFCHRAAA